MITGIRDVLSMILLISIIGVVFFTLFRSLSLSRIQSHIEEEIEYYKE